MLRNAINLLISWDFLKIFHYLKFIFNCKGKVNVISITLHDRSQGCEWDMVALPLPNVVAMVLISLSKFNLTLIGTFKWPTPPGPYRVTTCRGRELHYGSHTYFLTTQGHGGPPRMSDQPYAGATSETAQTVIPTRRIWNDDDDGQMMFGDLGGLKFPDICLTGGEKPRKNLTQETCPDRGSNPGPLRDKRACYQVRYGTKCTNSFYSFIACIDTNFIF